MNTIRPYRWHDWPRFQRLAKRGISLDVEASLTRRTGTLRNTLLAALPADVGGLPTYVLRGNGSTAIGQLRHHPDDTYARIAFAAPAPQPGDEARWETLLEGLTVAAGQRGATNLIAEVDESGPAYEGLRQVGFAVYARQEIWRRDPKRVSDGTMSAVRPFRPTDVFGATVLYANVVPGLLRQVEPAPALDRAAFVLAEGGDLVGLITAQHGPGGYLLDAYLHPSAEARTGEAITGTLRAIRAHRQPVYFRVRRYQTWLGNRLSRYGFELMGQQAMMVKHTAVRVEQPAFQLLPAIDGGARASTPTPFVDRVAPREVVPTLAALEAAHRSQRLLDTLETSRGLTVH